ncbi:MAG TPA: hypothetical protein VFV60_06745 [bacterium]|nr:hypothetical protein [bacterium]
MAHRLKLEDVACEVAPSRSRARVQLRDSGLTHVGLASSRTEGEDWHAVVAQATVNAVRMYVGFTGTQMHISLGTVKIIPEPRPVVLVSITAESQGRELSLVGSAPMRDEPQRAVARAVLQALNRQIEGIAAAEPHLPAPG